jgi:hypothetical protein
VTAHNKSGQIEYRLSSFVFRKSLNEIRGTNDEK